MTDRVRAHFFVCVNARPDGHPLPSCGRRGGTLVYEALSRELARQGFPADLKVTPTGCLTPCQHGPNVVVYPEGTWYANVTPGDVAELLAAHAGGAGPVSRLELPEEVRVS